VEQHSPSSEAHRVVLVEDEEAVRALLRWHLQDDGRFEVVGESADGAQGIELIAALKPSIVILDLQLPGVDGLEAIPAIREVSPATRIVVFSAFPDPYTLLDVLRLGADSYLDKATAWKELLPTVVALCELTTAEPR